MREKIILRRGDEVFGIRYDEKEHTFFAGGPLKINSSAEEALRYAFGTDTIERADKRIDGNRWRLDVGKMSFPKWEKGKGHLVQCGWDMQPVRKFGRLMN